MITVLDIGSSKVCAMIAEVSELGDVRVLGTGQFENKGVQHGTITDMALTEQAIRKAISKAEAMAGLTIESIWASLSVPGLRRGEMVESLERSGNIITREDIDALLRKAYYALPTHEGQHMLHAEPVCYQIDQQGVDVKNPLGMHAEKLHVLVHMISCNLSTFYTFDTCIHNASLMVHDSVASPVVTGLACLAQEERELGIALVELGAGVTTVSLYASGVLVDMQSLRFGGHDITHDIAAVFGTRTAHAERLKCLHGAATSIPRDSLEMIDIHSFASEAGDGSEMLRISRAHLIQIIRERLDRQFTEIGTCLEAMGYSGPLGTQVVLTGGGAELKGIADYAQAFLVRNVRIAKPKGLIGLPESFNSAAFSTLAGLALYAASNPVHLKHFALAPQTPNKKGLFGIAQKLLKALKSEI